MEEESDPSVFVMSPSALESLSPEEAAAAIEGMVSMSNKTYTYTRLPLSLRGIDISQI